MKLRGKFSLKCMCSCTYLSTKSTSSRWKQNDKKCKISYKWVVKLSIDWGWKLSLSHTDSNPLSSHKKEEKKKEGKNERSKVQQQSASNSVTFAYQISLICRFCSTILGKGKCSSGVSSSCRSFLFFSSLLLGSI